MRVGDEFLFRAPFGQFMLSKNPKANLIFCATGAGIAPLRSMILTETKSPTPGAMKLFYGGRNAEDIPYLDEIEKWAPANLKIRLAFSRETDSKKLGPYGQSCRITKFLEEGDFDQLSEFHICGNGDMVMGVSDLLQKKGVNKDLIFMERFN